MFKEEVFIENHIEHIFKLVNSIKVNKNNILDLYITVQSELYEVSQEDEEKFLDILFGEIKGFLKKTDSTSKLLKKSPFVVELNEDDIETLETFEDFKKCTEILEFLIEEIGCDGIIEIEEEFEELAYISENNFEEGIVEKMEILSTKKDFINEILEEVIELTSELEVLLEIDEVA